VTSTQLQIVTAVEQGGTEGFLPGFGSKQALKKSSVSLTKIQKQLETIAGRMLEMGGRLTAHNGTYQLDELSFSLTIDGKGEISLLGLTGISAGAGGTIKLVLKRAVSSTTSSTELT
jgi:hypothetical protein